MSEYFAVSMCHGPFIDLDSETLARTIQALVSDFGPDHFGDYWLNISSDEDVLESAAHDLGEEITFNDRTLWIQTVQWYIAREIYRAAKAIYFERRTDVDYTWIDNCPWIISGGMADLEYPAEACQKIDLIRWSGLDRELLLYYLG